MQISKTHMVRNWEEWKEFCREHNVDPEEVFEYGFDLGGGNSFDVYVHDSDIPLEVKEKWTKKYMS